MNEVIINLGLFQVVLPTVLILANIFVPAASHTSLILRSTALILLLLFAALAGLWLFPPWWTPWLLILFALFGAVHRYRRTRTAKRRILRVGEGIAAGAAILFSLLLLWPTIQGRTAPDGAVDLTMPLGPGRYLVTNGGTTESLNAHLLTLNLERARNFRGQSRAVDIIAIDRFGLRADGISPEDPSAYLIHGLPVLAPCEGTVARIIDSVPDMRVPTMDRANMTGNSVMLECKGHHVVLAHLAPGSITVREGRTVTPGTHLGKAGNSGNTNEPHLHIHVQTGLPVEFPISSEPVWFTLDGRFPVRNDRFVVP